MKLRTIKDLVAAALVGLCCVTLNGCLITVEPAFVPKDAKAIPGVEGTWHAQAENIFVNTLNLKRVSGGKYRATGLPATEEPGEVLTVPLHNGFFIVQVGTAEGQYEFELMRLAGENIEWRWVDQKNQALAKRALIHGMLLDPENPQLHPQRVLTKADIVGFFRDAIALNAVDQQFVILGRQPRARAGQPSTDGARGEPARQVVVPTPPPSPVLPKPLKSIESGRLGRAAPSAPIDLGGAAK